jgi:hypothetical protein
MKQNKNVTDEQLIAAYNKYGRLGLIAVELGIPKVSVYRRCGALGLKFQNGGQNKGLGRVKYELQDILEGKYPQYPTRSLKGRILKENILPNKCAECGIEEWNGKALVLHLDHIDGNPHNHLLTNLQLLCPNCHSQTDTYCGKNKI